MADLQFTLQEVLADVRAALLLSVHSADWRTDNLGPKPSWLAGLLIYEDNQLKTAHQDNHNIILTNKQTKCNQ